MAISPLPDIRKLRTTLLSVLAVLYLVLVLVARSLLYGAGDIVEVLFYLTAILSGMWILQWSVFAGAARPEQRSSIGLVVLLALAFGCMDALLVAGWNMLPLSVLGWVGPQGSSDWVSFFMLAGFIFGVVLVAFTGWRLPRYGFLSLMLLLHVIGGAILGAMIVIPISYRDTVAEGFFETSASEILSGLSILATVVVMWWGIAPITYLIAYRGYRQRLAASEAIEPSNPGGGQQGLDL